MNGAGGRRLGNAKIDGRRPWHLLLPCRGKRDNSRPNSMLQQSPKCLFASDVSCLFILLHLLSLFLVSCDCATARLRLHGAKVSPGRRRLHWADFPPMLTASQQPPPVTFLNLAIPAGRRSVDSCWWTHACNEFVTLDFMS